MTPHTSASLQCLLNKVWNHIPTINVCMDVWTRFPKSTLYLTGLGLVLIIYWTRRALSNFDLLLDHSFYSIHVYDRNILIGCNICGNSSSIILSLVNIDIDLRFHILRILIHLFFILNSLARTQLALNMLESWYSNWDIPTSV